MVDKNEEIHILEMMAKKVTKNGDYLSQKQYLAVNLNLKKAAQWAFGACA